MKNKTDRHDLLDRVLKAHVNILSLIYSHFYFPCSLQQPQRCGALSRLFVVRDRGIRDSKYRLEDEMGINQGSRVEAETHNLQPGRLPGTQEGHRIHSCSMCLDAGGCRETSIEKRRTTGSSSP